MVFVRHPLQLLLLSSFILLLLFSSVVVVYVSFWRGFHDILFYFIILMPLSLSTFWNKSWSYYNNTNTNTNRNNTAAVIIRIFSITSIIITCLQIIRINNVNTNSSYGNYYEQQQQPQQQQQHHQQQQQPQQQQQQQQQQSITQGVLPYSRNNGNSNNNTKSSSSSLSSSSSSSSSEEPIKKILRYENKSNHNNNKNKKFFVLHIGPSKTGTTSIQKDSGSKDFYKELQKDNTIYVGKFADPSHIRSDSEIQTVWNKSKNCMIQFYKKEISGNSSKNKKRMFTSKQKEYYRKLLLQKCLPIEYQYILQGSNNNKDNNQNDDDSSGMSTGMMNIIDSDERYSYYKPDVRDLEEITNIFIHIFDYTEILLVGSYRQYSNWIISTYGEWSRQKCLKKYIYFPSMQQKEFELVELEQEQELLSISDRTISESKSKSKTTKSKSSSSIKLNSKKNSGTCPNIWSSYIMDHVNGSYSKNNYRGRYTFYNNIDTTLNLISNNTNNGETNVNVNMNVSNSNASNNNNSNSNSNNLSNIPSGVSIHILNYFQQSPDNSNSNSNSNSNNNYNSITTEFYCKLLGPNRTPNTCQHSEGRQVNDIIVHREMGSYNLERVLYDTISIELYKRLRYNKRYRYIGGAGSSLLVNRNIIITNNNLSNSSSNNNNDGKIINSTAALLSDRLELRKYVHDYHRRHIIESLSSESKSDSDSNSINNSTTNTNITSSSISMVNYLPLLCPSKMELNLLLNKSIQFEELVMPFLIFDNNNNNDNDNDNDNDNNDDSTSSTTSSANNGIIINDNNNNNNHELSRRQQQQSQSQLRYRQKRIVQMKKEHISNFWNILVNKKKSFCWIDIPRLFATIDNNTTESITSSSLSLSLLLSLDDILDTLFTTTKWTTTVIA